MHKLYLYHVVCASPSTFVLNARYALSVNISELVPSMGTHYIKHRTRRQEESPDVGCVCGLADVALRGSSGVRPTLHCTSAEPSRTQVRPGPGGSETHCPSPNST